VISDQLARFIASHLVSVEQIEILLFLRQHHDRAFSPSELNDVIRSSESSVGSRLTDLERRGLVRREHARFRYQPPSELEGVLGELAAAYAEQRYTIIDLIFSKSNDKLQAFADAFKVRTGKDGDDDG
jgi:DNA-binding Lrp family transcriptional regulator